MTTRTTDHGRTTGRTALGTAALVLAAFSAVALLVMIGGDLAGFAYVALAVVVSAIAVALTT